MSETRRRVLGLMLATTLLATGAARVAPVYADPPQGQAIVILQPGAALAVLDARQGTTELAALPDAQTYQLALPAGEPVSAGLAALGADPAVLYAVPNVQVQMPEGNPSSHSFFDGFDASAAEASQYALGLINAPQAWSLSTGQGVTVAVLDTGVDLTHPALAGRLVPGYDFVDGTGTPADVPTGLDTNGDGSPDDAVGHGTHVAGIVAMTAPGATIMPVKVLDSDGVGTSFAVAQGIEFAVDNGAQVINLSLGVAGRDRTIEHAIAYANAHNVVVVASDGNNGMANAVQSPAAEVNTVAVCATDSGDQLASFSNYGPPVDVCAPGVNIISLYYNGGYATWSGTSMAAPFVSGEAALIRAFRPAWNAGRVVADICKSADNIDAVNPAYAGLLGAGRIDLSAALIGNGGAAAPVRADRSH